MSLYDYNQVITEGKNSAESVDPFEKPSENDYPIFSYTSGTTGDSKGVKLTHKNLLHAGHAINKVMELHSEDIEISYLPYTHSFEQCILGTCVQTGVKIGFYQGDPLKLVEDCAKL